MNFIPPLLTSERTNLATSRDTRSSRSFFTYKLSSNLATLAGPGILSVSMVMRSLCAGDALDPPLLKVPRKTHTLSLSFPFFPVFLFASSTLNIFGVRD